MPNSSSHSVKAFFLNTDEIVRRLRQDGADVVREHAEVRLVHLFGSLARGDAIPGSDADVIIVVDESQTRFIDRPLIFQPYFDGCGVGVDILVYTAHELARMRSEGNPFIRRAFNEGFCLASRDDAGAY
jgi:predicted nucleotidyltransferase